MVGRLASPARPAAPRTAAQAPADPTLVGAGPTAATPTINPCWSGAPPSSPPSRRCCAAHSAGPERCCSWRARRASARPASSARSLRPAAGAGCPAALRRQTLRVHAGVRTARGGAAAAPGAADPRRAAIGRLLGGGACSDRRTGANLRHQVIDEIVDLVEMLAAHGPLLVALEDLHWADDASVVAFRALATGLRRPARGHAAARTPVRRSGPGPRRSGGGGRGWPAAATASTRRGGRSRPRRGRGSPRGLRSPGSSPERAAIRCGSSRSSARSPPRVC
jgi:hypothetical protein